MEPRERELVISLADVSDYTRFMIENQPAAVHGRQCIMALIETMVREVEIRPHLQEVEVDGLLLHSAHPGVEAGSHPSQL